MPNVFRDVAAFLRHQYSLSYSPTTGAKDGKFHKVKVELVAPDGGPLSIVDQKGKKQKYQVYAREGYQAPKAGVGDSANSEVRKSKLEIGRIVRPLSGACFQFRFSNSYSPLNRRAPNPPGC